MRYTEIRMAKIGHELLADIDKGNRRSGPTTRFRKSRWCSPRIPNLLINGSGAYRGGHGQTSAHNLSEVVDACQKLLAEPDVSIDE